MIITDNIGDVINHYSCMGSPVVHGCHAVVPGGGGDDNDGEEKKMKEMIMRIVMMRKKNGDNDGGVNCKSEMRS